MQNKETERQENDWVLAEDDKGNGIVIAAQNGNGRGVAPRKRPRTAGVTSPYLEPETSDEEDVRPTPPPPPAPSNIESSTAMACGINPTGLTDDELGLLPAGCNVKEYCAVRNQMLAKWRKNVSKYFSQEDALNGLAKEKKPYALAAWRFLNTMGYINFGFTLRKSAVPVNSVTEAFKPESTPLGTIVVVGAGCAGLSAARQLLSMGYRVVVVEGRDRPGGRVHTVQMNGPGGAKAVADLGGSIVTGIDGNPIAILCKQLGFPLVTINSQTPLFMPDGSEAPAELDAEIEKLHNEFLDICDTYRATRKWGPQNQALGDVLEWLWESSGRGKWTGARQLFDWHLANLEFANASSLDVLCAKHWDQDDPNELQGEHCFVPGCNLRWLSKLTDGVPIFYNSPVKEIRYSQQGVAIHTDKRILQADAVVVTVPLGVLKKESITFNPPLPDRKIDAIKRLGFGSLNKVVMLFPSPFWGEHVDMFGHVSEIAELRGAAFLFYSYTHISGGHVLIGLMAGQAAVDQENLPPEDSASAVMEVLRTIFERRGVDVPPPLEVICTKWGSDPFAYGAYSSMAVGTLGGQDYDTLGESVANRVFFAGEATSSKYPATMHGAFYTGLWTAANVHATMKRERNPPPLILTPEGGLVTGNTAEVMPPGWHPHPELLLALRLKKLFEDPMAPPDLDFGCFTAVHGPARSASAGKSLLRVDVAKFLKQSSALKDAASLWEFHRPLVLYVMVTVDVALGLADTPGDDTRLAILSSIPGVNLVDRARLSKEAEGLVEAVLMARGVPVPLQVDGAPRVMPPPVPRPPSAAAARNYDDNAMDIDDDGALGDGFKGDRNEDMKAHMQRMLANGLGSKQQQVPSNRPPKPTDRNLARADSLPNNTKAAAAGVKKEEWSAPSSASFSPEKRHSDEKQGIDGVGGGSKPKQPSGVQNGAKSSQKADSKEARKDKDVKRKLPSTATTAAAPSRSTKTVGTTTKDGAGKSTAVVVGKDVKPGSGSKATTKDTFKRPKPPVRPSSAPRSDTKDTTSHKPKSSSKPHSTHTTKATDECSKREEAVNAIRCIFCKKLQPEESMLLCDGCDKAYHMECMRPPIKVVPSGNWYCDDCVKREADAKRSGVGAKRPAPLMDVMNNEGGKVTRMERSRLQLLTSIGDKEIRWSELDRMFGGRDSEVVAQIGPLVQAGALVRTLPSRSGPLYKLSDVALKELPRWEKRLKDDDDATTGTVGS